ncbi:HAMP domain-containing sensor histidine kinase [Williamsia maris]|uniref:histidine kinase n=1 Tax=Williamsia maris TaxID=72806 RepID=A0ABT1HCD3_9NOCA|nr:HAMP domain-containing sensor histidine kinase [Williamsia maris]MCP2175919.1 Signal transduction histidine kinase [Williamsia maris]
MRPRWTPGRRTPAARVGDPPTTATPSLRRRVLVVVVALFAFLLVVVGVSVDIALGHQLRSDLSARLTDRADRSVSLAAQGYSPQDLVSALQGDAIRVRLQTSDGTVYGGPPQLPNDVATGDEPTPIPPDGGRRGPGANPDPSGLPQGPGAGPGRGGPPRPATDSLVVSRRLPDGSTLTLLGDTTSITQVRHQLRWLMAGAGAATLLIAALAMVIAVRRALRPLDAMVAVARGITSGDRGRRVRPQSPDTELGRAAGSVDEMLDALESAEAAQRAAADVARRAEAETKRFLADAAHELRTPIAGLSAVAESLSRDGTSRPDRLPRWTELLLGESRHAARLVDDLLDLARIDADPALIRADVDLVEVVSLAAERSRLVTPGAQIELTGSQPVPVSVDAGRIGQVVANLIDNAVRVTPPGGVIDADVSVSDTVATVTITDHGPGIPDDQRERIFERLVRLEESRASVGAGLGLPIARALARAHGGDVVCAPHVGGARFVLSLPLGVTNPSRSLSDHSGSVETTRSSTATGHS